MELRHFARVRCKLMLANVSHVHEENHKESLQEQNRIRALAVPPPARLFGAALDHGQSRQRVVDRRDHEHSQRAHDAHLSTSTFNVHTTRISQRRASLGMWIELMRSTKLAQMHYPANRFIET